MAWTRRPRTSSPWNGWTGSTTEGSSTTSAASHPPNTRSTTTFKPSQTIRSRLTRSSLHETRGGSTSELPNAALASLTYHLSERADGSPYLEMAHLAWNDSEA